MLKNLFMKNQLKIEQSCRNIFGYCEAQDYIGYGKFDALNSSFLRFICRNNKWLRLIVTQVIKRSSINIRPIFGIKKYKNPKAMALFSRGYLNLYQVFKKTRDLDKARYCLDWLAENSAEGFSGHCWGYNWDWQDLGFFAPYGSPNCVVTTYVGQAFLDAYECMGYDSYLEIAKSSLEFIRKDLKILYEDSEMKCVSYVPANDIRMAVMDVSALAGALMARVNKYARDAELAVEAKKLMNYVVGKQTDYGAWYYTYPPQDSLVKHDNYHTGFILNAILDYELATEDMSFRSAYIKGLEFYFNHLFLKNGAPKWMSHKKYPFDIHGAATGIETFSKASLYFDKFYFDIGNCIAKWAIDSMQDSKGYFYYQKGRMWTKKFTLMRWCNAWMAYALSCLLLSADKIKSN